MQAPKRRGRLLRFLLFIGLGFVVLIGGIIGLAFWATQAMTTAGNDFMAAAAGPQPATAWRMAAPEPQRSASEPAFVEFIASRGFPGAKVSWDERRQNNNDGRLRGTMTWRDGQTVPIRFDLRKNAGSVWQVMGVFLGADAAGGS